MYVMSSTTSPGHHRLMRGVGAEGAHSPVVCSDVRGHKPFNIASRACLCCHKQAALVIAKAVNIDYAKWLSRYSHKYTLITHPWVDVFRFGFEK